MESERILLQLNIVGVVGCFASFQFGREVIIMEPFLEFLREVLKGMIRAISAYYPGRARSALMLLFGRKRRDEFL
jgi:hypothetical protein